MKKTQYQNIGVNLVLSDATLDLDEQLLELANTGTQLPDIMGELCSISNTIANRLLGRHSVCRVMLTSGLEREANVCVSMFDSLGWCYIGCSKKLIREEYSFTCVACNETNALAELR
ncbi:Uncharacterized protein Rs2_37896 [Raphanus sativus]|nr:Uncharacterized protein Rs2_37896 [Raphanus sativus]